MTNAATLESVTLLGAQQLSPVHTTQVNGTSLFFYEPSLRSLRVATATPSTIDYYSSGSRSIAAQRRLAENEAALPIDGKAIASREHQFVDETRNPHPC